MRHRLASCSTLTILGLALVAPACGGPAATPASPAPALGPDPYGVVLLDAGAEPRAPLRVQVPTGTRRTVAHAMELSAEGLAPSSVRSAWTLEVTEVTTTQPPTMTVAMTVDDGPLGGARGTWSIDERGHVSPPDGVDGARTVLQQSLVEHLIPTVPREAIGPGARWTAPIAMSTGVGEASLPGTITWELEAVHGTHVELAGALDIPEGDTASSQGPMRFATSATLDVALDLATLAGEASMDMAMTLALGEGDEVQRMSSRARVSATLR